MRAVVAHDLLALQSGTEPEPCDPVQLCSFLAEDGDTQAKAAIGVAGPARSADPGDLIRNARPSEALERRLPKLRSDWYRLGILWQPKLVRVVGGGRAIQSRYRLEFEPLDAVPEIVPAPAAGVPVEIQYEVLPLTASWPFRWLFVEEGFEISFTSWRGIAYITWVLLTILTVVFFLFVGIVLSGAALNGRGSLLEAVMAFACAFVFWRCAKPFLEVASVRILNAPQILLPMSEIFGQLKFVRRRDLKIPRGWLSLVRVRSQCPFCESEVDLEDGARDFPGRTVGRCREAPAEHVFSFDPTSNRGTWLRDGR